MGMINDDKNIKSTKQDVDRYIANMGGTAIFEPLSYSINEFMTGVNFDGIYAKKIFLLTDGAVKNPEKVI